MEEYRRQPEDNLGVEVVHSSNKFYFTVEGTGAISAPDIVRYALRELAEKLGRLQNATMHLEESRI
jgi:hypothetical protein